LFFSDETEVTGGPFCLVRSFQLQHAHCKRKWWQMILLHQLWIIGWANWKNTQ